MSNRKNILAISGSTRSLSANLTLIKAIGLLYADSVNIKVFDGLAVIPHFNPDLDHGNPPEAVSDFRRQLREADGVLICTPEYAMGVPGTLKNAIDWTVSSMEFSNKPVALITASTAGQKGHRSLMETLQVIEANIPESSQLIISHVKTKVKDTEIIEESTVLSVKRLIDSLLKTIDTKVT